MNLLERITPDIKATPGFRPHQARRLQQELVYALWLARREESLSDRQWTLLAAEIRRRFGGKLKQPTLSNAAIGQRLKRLWQAGQDILVEMSFREAWNFVSRPAWVDRQLERDRKLRESRKGEVFWGFYKKGLKRPIGLKKI